MTGPAITLMLVAMVVVWGGLGSAIWFLARQPERDDLPPGGEDEHVDPAAAR